MSTIDYPTRLLWRLAFDFVYSETLTIDVVSIDPSAYARVADWIWEHDDHNRFVRSELALGVMGLLISELKSRHNDLAPGSAANSVVMLYDRLLNSKPKPPQRRKIATLAPPPRRATT